MKQGKQIIEFKIPKITKQVKIPEMLYATNVTIEISGSWLSTDIQYEQGKRRFYR